MEKLAKISQAKKDYQDAIKAVGKEDFRDLLAPLFEKYPGVKAVRWKQYTPFFNDGEPCTFRVNESFLRYDDLAEDAGDYEDGFEGYFEEPDRQEAMKAFDAALNVDKDIMEAVFGDHVEVTIERNGITIDDYDSHN